MRHQHSLNRTLDLSGPDCAEGLAESIGFREPVHRGDLPHGGLSNGFQVQVMLSYVAEDST